ncbi:MAG: peptide-methionine (S)-S-oxide reductase MsrA [Alphaproteobacteria bacterium]
MKLIYVCAVLIVIAGAVLFFSGGHTRAGQGLLKQGEHLMTDKSQLPENTPSIILGGGCFWCLESEFRALSGVLYTQVGYMGGHVENVTYDQITTGKTGHAEVIEVFYDPDKISYGALVDHFLRKAHDPTQLNRQGVDIGTQYRSEIFYRTEQERNIATETITKIDAEKIYNAPIVTKVSEAQTFWMGEDYHQQYYEKYRAKNGQDHIRVLIKKQR